MKSSCGGNKWRKTKICSAKWPITISCSAVLSGCTSTCVQPLPDIGNVWWNANDVQGQLDAYKHSDSRLDRSICTTLGHNQGISGMTKFLTFEKISIQARDVSQFRLMPPHQIVDRELCWIIHERNFCCWFWLSEGSAEKQMSEESTYIPFGNVPMVSLEIPN